ncbi:aldehyde dehydrogenase family protein [Fodinicola acaciae]|uniref:aldehyde dehydrogenase family protein n=1 Tax=Fodinicola acaciae TaxID=2681555 RepID=UPI0013D48129|nr:aldehyde dehydrogenase family protein [Fodinicola acaciae]
MTVTEPAAATEQTFDSLNPATGDVVGRHRIWTDAEVNEAVQRARKAAAWWAELGFADRGRVLRAWRSVLIRRSAELAELMHQENGKPHADAMIEIVLAADHLDWASKHAKKTLGQRRVSSGMLMINQSATLEYQPLGVVGVIGPWNYPVFTPAGSIVYALAAGNAVVFKPSEYTPGVGQWLADSFREVAGDLPLFQVVTGLGATGAALCRSGVDKLAFTGSAATGKKVMMACAETLTPVIIEAGGKDALLVDEDANLDAAADAAVWGGMSNAGQTCVGVERVYVHERVYDTFVDKVVGLAKDLKAGDGEPIGPITMPSQLNIIRRHIADAIEHGGRALVGGLDAVGDRYVQPTVLVDVPEESAAVREETFGPTLTIAKVPDMDEALKRANTTSYGLGGAVFSRARGLELARRMRSGMTSVNGVITFAGVPSLPFGGVGDSGFGRIHGPDGLREFARPKAITRQRFASPVRTTTFTRRASDDRQLLRLARMLYGRR